MSAVDVKEDALTKTFRFVVPAEELGVYVLAFLKEKQKTFLVDGFRRGAAPLAAVEKRYRSEALQAAAEHVIQARINKTLTEEKLALAQRPTYAIEGLSPEGELSFTLEVVLAPTIEVISKEGIVLENLEAEITDADVDAYLAEQAEDFLASEPLPEQRALERGDVVTVDVVLSGKKIPKEDRMEQEGRYLIPTGAPNEERFPLASDDLTERLLGKKVGDSTVFEQTFHSKDNRVIAATLTITIKKIEKQVPAKVDEEFAKGRGFEDLATMRENALEELKEKVKFFSEMWVRRQVFDLWEAKNPVEVSHKMIDRELRDIWKKTLKELGIAETALEENVPEAAESLFQEEFKMSSQELKEHYKTLAQRRVRMRFILEKMAEEAPISFEPDELNQIFRQFMETYPGSKEQALAVLKDEALRMSVLEPFAERKIVAKWVESVPTQTKKVSFQEVQKMFEEVFKAYLQTTSLSVSDLLEGDEENSEEA